MNQNLALYWYFMGSEGLHKEEGRAASGHVMDKFSMSTSITCPGKQQSVATEFIESSFNFLPWSLAPE